MLVSTIMYSSRDVFALQLGVVHARFEALLRAELVHGHDASVLFVFLADRVGHGGVDALCHGGLTLHNLAISHRVLNTDRVLAAARLRLLVNGGLGERERMNEYLRVNEYIFGKTTLCIQRM